MLQELASASRARDYINHLESKLCRESGYVEQMLLEENLKKLSEIETNIQTETWTVIKKMDTIMLNNWLNEASEYQTEMNKTISYQKGGELDWETNEFKLSPNVTKKGAIAPEPIQLTTDACFPPLC